MIDNSTSEIVQLLQYLNESGGKIPIQLTTTVSTQSSQFYLNFALGLIGTLFVLMFLYSRVQPMIANTLISSKLKSIKKQTGRNVVLIKHTSSGMFDMSMINQRTMTQITKAMEKFKGKPFDLVLHTPGGEIFSSMFISRLLREYPAEIRIFVPYFAMSGGTLLALSGKKIFMSPTACLGPVDPQLGNLFKYGSAKSWDKIFKYKGKKADDQSISFAFTGAQYTRSIALYLNEILEGKMNPQDRKLFVKFLTSGDVEHAFPLTISTLNRFGLKALPLDNGITQKLNKIISSNMYEGVYAI